MVGNDLASVARVGDVVTMPVPALGRACSLADGSTLIGWFGTIGVWTVSLFVFKGTYRAVSVNYPSRGGNDELLGEVRAAHPNWRHEGST
jgi:cyclase